MSPRRLKNSVRYGFTASCASFSDFLSVNSYPGSYSFGTFGFHFFTLSMAFAKTFGSPIAAVVMILPSCWESAAKATKGLSPPVPFGGKHSLSNRFLNCPA